MGLVDELTNKVRDYLAGDYEVSNTKVIPNVQNVPFGKKAKKMKLCAFAIDLRKSSDLLFQHQKQTSGKIHKAFLTVVSRVVLNYGGKIRSFQGDSILAFWPSNNKSETSKAVEAAMVIKWFLTVKLSKLFQKYKKLDFGIGIDRGEVYILRAGVSKNSNNNDLIFIGKCVNFAVEISNQAKSPDNIEISNSIYTHLENNCIFSTIDGSKENMWKKSSVKWNKKVFPTKVTNFYWFLS